MSGRIAIEGKFFRCGSTRFDCRGVTYGTFVPRSDGARFPATEQIKLDFEGLQSAGFTVVRTYTMPPDDLLDAAADHGLRVLADVFYPDWRYLLGVSARERRRVLARARDEVAAAARRLEGDERVLALSLGNEVPADVVRWTGTHRIARAIGALAETVREIDPEMLVTYGNYPTAEYLPLDTLDFLTFNVYLEQRQNFREYLNRLHQLAGDRPLVLGEIGLDAGTTPAGADRQAAVLDWQLETALERGVAGTCVFSWTDEWWVGDHAVDGWHFGLTGHDRMPRKALAVAAKWNGRTVRDLEFPWPSLSVVICAYNAAATIDECLRHTCALDYPNLEIIVVDDGSTDGTAAIAARHPRARVLAVPHGGLAVARNEGYRKATGRLVAYLDSDAFPTPEWPYYLALAFDRPKVGGAGGPNLPPAEDDRSAHVVARSPGGPVHVLLSDDRAEHVPGCNMAFWREVLDEVGGFDPVYTAAGDDVDLCWKALDRGWDIAFHPAAVVWHHRRPGLVPYLRQQRGYGRSEALVEARHPDRFTTTGTARWRGRIYNSVGPSATRQRIYRGVYGAAAFQSVYRVGGHRIDLLHQVGVPVAALALLTAPLGLVWGWAALPALAALALVGGLAVHDAATVDTARSVHRGRLRFRMSVAIHHLLQPLARTWGRIRSRRVTHAEPPSRRVLPTPVGRVRGVTVVPEDRPRAEFADVLVGEVRRAGFRVLPSSGWDDHDGRVLASTLVTGDLQTSSHPEGFIQVRVRRRLRLGRLGALLGAALSTAIVSEPELALLIVTPGAVETLRGVVRLHRLPRRILPLRGEGGR